ncbi:MarR family transcriptional regulator [Amycolatopsis sp. K13G38]|uniref:MarR family transcriptional regulator n=1 Tax=Amycolatopsis acididurans TaxID=2724524 RepID=A0ABX1JHW8_9PSEU|nr:MarR family transcriptional regulator [Amycolatopsis acididurans]NKQ59226.1 MarR family transcriptional regulator [Amycolatopsis acididurans]
MKSGVAELAHELRPLVFRLYYVVRRLTPQHRLSLTQGSVLSELVTGGPRRMSVLAELEGVRQPSMTDLVRRLERLGLVSRAPDPDDRRAVLITATEAGKEYVEELVVAREEFLRERLTALDPAERTAIEAALPALRRLVDPAKKEELLDER